MLKVKCSSSPFWTHPDQPWAPRRSHERVTCMSSHGAQGDLKPFQVLLQLPRGQELWIGFSLLAFRLEAVLSVLLSAVQPLEWPLVIPVPFHSPIQETTPGTRILSSTLLSWTHQAAHPRCWPQPLPLPHRPLASLSSLHLRRPRDLGAATHPARPRLPQDPTAQTMPSACWMRSCSAWVRPGGRL